MQHVNALSRNVMIISVEENLATKIKSLQHGDDGLKHIFKILKPFDDFLLRNGVLYKYVDGYELLVVPKALEDQVIKSTPENGHFEVKKIEEKIKQQYFIPSLRSEIAEMCETLCSMHCIGE